MPKGEFVGRDCSLHSLHRTCLQFAHDLFLSLMSNFKMPKGEFVCQFAQAPWISLHKHNLNFRDRQFTSGVSISGFLYGK
jgi:hypothetical protein